MRESWDTCREIEGTQWYNFGLLAFSCIMCMIHLLYFLSQGFYALLSSKLACMFRKVKRNENIYILEHCIAFHVIIDNWAMTCDFQQYGILTSVDSDEPVQPPYQLRNSKWCSVSSLRVRIFKRQAKALIRLLVFAGWSETLLVAHTTVVMWALCGHF